AVDDAAFVGAAAGAGIRSGGVEAPPARQDDGIVVVVELAGEKVGAREAVVLGSVMPVVLVDRDRVPSEAAVLGNVERQPVVVAEEDGLAVADLHQLGWQRPVERPQRQRSLVGQARVEGRSDLRSGVDAGVERRSDAGVVDGVDLGPFLRGLNGDRGSKPGELLVPPDRSRWTPFDGTGVTGSHAL